MQNDGWDQPYDPINLGGGNGGTPDGSLSLYDAVAQIFRTATGHDGTPEQIHQWADGKTPADLGGIQQGIYNSDEAKAFGAHQSQLSTPPPSVPGPTGGGGGPTISNGMDPSATFQPPQVNGLPSWLPSAPAAPAGLSLPDFGKAPAYAEPNYEAALQDPAYQFEAGQGRQQMEQSAAARGVLNGGGTLKDINAWGQNFATQRVNDVRDRSVNNYLLNYQTQYVDPYKYAYQKALDTFTGGLNLWQGANSQWQTKAQVGQRNAEDTWQQAYTPFNDAWNRRITVGLA